MDALDLLQMHANMIQELQILAFAGAYNNETCIRDYGDLTSDRKPRTMTVEDDDESDND